MRFEMKLFSQIAFVSETHALHINIVRNFFNVIATAIHCLTMQAIYGCKRATINVFIIFYL